MPRVLFIRVSAATYDEKDVPKTWPALYAAIWPDAQEREADSVAKLARSLAPSPKRGVLELAGAFAEHARFGRLPEQSRAALASAAERLEVLLQDLEAALGNRDVHKAEKLCTAIEDTLDEAESVMRELL